MKLIDALAQVAAGRRRVPRLGIWRAFQLSQPIGAAAVDARDQLAGQLRALAADGALGLPAESGRGWDRSAWPPLPEWLSLPNAASPSPPAESSALRSFPWAPELAFLSNLPNLAYAAEAHAIQQFLSRGGRQRPVVPMRERSVQLFGDEKRMDGLLRTPLFGEGRLDLKILRCFHMAPPLVYERGPATTGGKPCLVIENHHTWWSFCRWNERAAAYSAVVYGAGNGFGREAVAFLAENCITWRAPHAAYFGDLDPEGLKIPWRAATNYAPSHHIRILPELRWYRCLLQQAQLASLPVGRPIEPGAAITWLAELGPEVLPWFGRGVRIPQELVGTEALADEA